MLIQRQIMFSNNEISKLDVIKEKKIPLDFKKKTKLLMISL